jgi:hypothetical protein
MATLKGFEPSTPGVTGRYSNHLSYSVVVGREGFEPSKAEPSDLQSDPFNHSGTYPH